MSDVLQRVQRKVSERNFDNDITRMLNNRDRYGLDDGPLRIGTNTLQGATIEYILAIVDVMDELEDRIGELIQQNRGLQRELDELKAAGCSCDKADDKKAAKAKPKKPEGE